MQATLATVTDGWAVDMQVVKAAHLLFGGLWRSESLGLLVDLSFAVPVHRKCSVHFNVLSRLTLPMKMLFRRIESGDVA